MDKILKCDHSNESNSAEISCLTVYYAAQYDSNFRVCMKSKGVTIQIKATYEYFRVIHLFFQYSAKQISGLFWKSLSADSLCRERVKQIYHLHIISYVNRIQLIRQESVPQVHTLFLAARIDRYHAGIYHHYNPDDHLLFIKHG